LPSLSYLIISKKRFSKKKRALGRNDPPRANKVRLEVAFEGEKVIHAAAIPFVQRSRPDNHVVYRVYFQAKSDSGKSLNHSSGCQQFVGFSHGDGFVPVVAAAIFPDTESVTMLVSEPERTSIAEGIVSLLKSQAGIEFNPGSWCEVRTQVGFSIGLAHLEVAGCADLVAEVMSDCSGELWSNLLCCEQGSFLDPEAVLSECGGVSGERYENYDRESYHCLHGNLLDFCHSLRRVAAFGFKELVKKSAR